MAGKLLMAETLLCDKRAVFDYLAPIIDLSTVTRSMALLSLEVQRETNSRSSREREAVLSLHDIYSHIPSPNTRGATSRIRYLSFTILPASFQQYSLRKNIVY